MKTFQDWLQENNLNEISAELLQRAATTAQNRGDIRGQRLGDKFDQASQVKSQKEFASDPNKIIIDGVELKINNVEDKVGGFKIHCVNQHMTKYTLFIDMPGRGAKNQIANVTLRNMNNGEDFKIKGIERKHAMVIAKLLNIRPTILPLT